MSARKTTLLVEISDDPEPRVVVVKGREAWALQELMQAGSVGCTPIEQPGPRWSSYIHKLRRLRFDIESVPEPHGGAYAGPHVRYVLRSNLRLIGATDPSSHATSHDGDRCATAGAC